MRTTFVCVCAFGRLARQSSLLSAPSERCSSIVAYVIRCLLERDHMLIDVSSHADWCCSSTGNGENNTLSAQKNRQSIDVLIELRAVSNQTVIISTTTRHSIIPTQHDANHTDSDPNFAYSSCKPNIYCLHRCNSTRQSHANINIVPLCTRSII